MESNNKCVFCNNQELEQRIILKDNYAFVLPTNIPIVPGHVLICPIRHVESFDALNSEEEEHIFQILNKLKLSLIKTFGATGFNYAWNEGSLAGQNISHFHLHVLPRKEGDTGITKYDPREFLYRPGSRETTPDNELIAIAKLIKENI